MRQYMPGDTTQDTTTPIAMADIRAQAQQGVAQTQQQTAEGVESQKVGDIKNTGALTGYRPTVGWAKDRGGGGPRPGGGTGAEMGSINSYDGGKDAQEPIGVIRGMSTSYAAKGTGPEGEVPGGMLPEYADRTRALQASNKMADIGEYSPPNAEELALKHGYTMSEIEAKDKMSGGDQKESARLATANVGTFENAIAAEPHYLVDDGKGKKVLHPLVDKTAAFYSAQVAAGKMAPDEAVRQLNQTVVPQLYSEKVGTPQLADRQADAFTAHFQNLYGVKLDRNQVANYLKMPVPQDPAQAQQRQIFILKTLGGSQDIGAAKSQGMLSGAAPTAPVPGAPAPPAANLTVPSISTYAPGGQPTQDEFTAPPPYDIKPALRTMFNPPAYQGNLPDLSRRMLQGVD